MEKVISFKERRDSLMPGSLKETSIPTITPLVVGTNFGGLAAITLAGSIKEEKETSVSAATGKIKNCTFNGV